jgi:predicted RNase H-like nuclease (RuvC/YqgF family)
MEQIVKLLQDNIGCKDEIIRFKDSEIQTLKRKLSEVQSDEELKETARAKEEEIASLKRQLVEATRRTEQKELMACPKCRRMFIKGCGFSNHVRHCIVP